MFYRTFSKKWPKKNQKQTNNKKCVPLTGWRHLLSLEKHARFEFDIIFPANRKWFAAAPQSSPAGECCYLNNIYTSNYSLFLLSV